VIERRFAVSIRASRLLEAEGERGLEVAGWIRVFWAGLPEDLMNRGSAPETPVKGGVALDNPRFAILTDCERWSRQRSSGGLWEVPIGAGH
jgi:hypothetical protein